MGLLLPQRRTRILEGRLFKETVGMASVFSEALSTDNAVVMVATDGMGARVASISDVSNP